MAVTIPLAKSSFCFHLRVLSVGLYIYPWSDVHVMVPSLDVPNAPSIQSPHLNVHGLAIHGTPETGRGVFGEIYRHVERWWD